MEDKIMGSGGKIVLNILNCMDSWSRFHTRIVTMILDKIIFSKSVIGCGDEMLSVLTQSLKFLSLWISFEEVYYFLGQDLRHHGQES